jgi:hypothetical protein
MSMKQIATKALFHAGFLLGLLFVPEDGGVVYKKYLTI